MQPGPAQAAAHRARNDPRGAIRRRAAAILAAAFALALSMAGASPARAEPCNLLPPGRMVPDQHEGCLAVLPVGSRSPGKQALVVMLHGDRGGELEQRHVDGWRRVGQSLVRDDRTVLFLVRPGYRSPAGDSSGYANPRDDDYTAHNVARVAGALAALRAELQPRRVVLVGHSGGAAIAALVLGQHPGAADAALLLGCPCDVPPWRMHRSAQRNQGYRPWPASLNPLEAVAGIPAGTPVLAATGSRDDNTLPDFARRWSLAAAGHGARARFEEPAGHDHFDILRWPDLPARVESLIDALGR